MLENIINWFETMTPLMAALYATIFTWLMTAFGASIVFLFKKISRAALDGMLGFTGGVMIAAAFFSLLMPAIAMSTGEGLAKGIPVATGFMLGALFIFLIDKNLPHLHINFEVSEGMETSWRRTTLLVLAITMHNIPEGLAIGVLFGGVAAGVPEATISGAVILALGIGIQNIPEGIAVSMPLKRMGMSSKKSFIYGQGSAIVEPLFAVIGVLAVNFFGPLLPYALAFAAGAMIFVVVEEVIPETQLDDHTDLAALGFVCGFTIMMLLDVGLGS